MIKIINLQIPYMTAIVLVAKAITYQNSSQQHIRIVINVNFKDNSMNMLFSDDEYFDDLTFVFLLLQGKQLYWPAFEDQYLELNLMAHRFLRKNLILLLVTAVLTEPGHAQQNSKIDSLIRVLKTHKEDSSKVNTLNALSRELWITQIGRAHV